MKKFFITLLVMAACLFVEAATITRDATTTTFTETTDAGTVKFTFRKCMANELYTFYSVALDGKIVNSAQYSDNIGPFLVNGSNWIGGNHLSSTNEKTAKTVDIWITVDGTNLAAETRQGKVMTVNVVNELYMPDGSLFAIERMKYVVAGNSIEVFATHEYKITSTVTVDRYYGMQSMFSGETEILAPGAKKYNKWLTFTPGGSANAINIKNFEAPKFSVFVEKSANGYQASYMFREDLGNRSKVGYDDVVYIGNSYEKSYHKTIGSAKINVGETTKWHGVYSWFKNPVSDTFRTGADNPAFQYPAYIDGEAVTLTIDGTGTVTTPASGIDEATIAPASAAPGYYSLSGIRLDAPTPGQICLRVTANETTKVLVK